MAIFPRKFFGIRKISGSGFVKERKKIRKVAKIIGIGSAVASNFSVLLSLLSQIKIKPKIKPKIGIPNKNKTPTFKKPIIAENKTVIIIPNLNNFVRFVKNFMFINSIQVIASIEPK
jgi:hypothetical protein